MNDTQMKKRLKYPAFFLSCIADAGALPWHLVSMTLPSAAVPAASAAVFSDPSQVAESPRPHVEAEPRHELREGNPGFHRRLFDRNRKKTITHDRKNLVKRRMTLPTPDRLRSRFVSPASAASCALGAV
jgi:hypothetical protein